MAPRVHRTYTATQTITRCITLKYRVFFLDFGFGSPPTCLHVELLPGLMQRLREKCSRGKITCLTWYGTLTLR